MATAGLSLVGFMQRAAAIEHLRRDCLPDPPDAGDDALTAIWKRARGQLARPIERAGRPRTGPPPAAAEPYIRNLAAQPWVAEALRHLTGPRFETVEIDPLLALQPTIDLDRASGRAALSCSPPGLDEMLELCLPAAAPADEFQTSPVTALSETMTITSRDRGLTLTGWGIFNVNVRGFPSHIAGIRFHAQLPLVQAVLFDGRYHLYQGYHRAYAIRQAGSREMPCLVHEVTDPAQLDGGAIDIARLAGDNPPAMAHFTQGLALPVRLRAVSRVIEVGWRQYLRYDE